MDIRQLAPPLPEHEALFENKAVGVVVVRDGFVERCLHRLPIRKLKIDQGFMPADALAAMFATRDTPAATSARAGRRSKFGELAESA
jgi:hypothetical protein